MRNLMRINNYYNKFEAWRDWALLVAKVVSEVPELIDEIERLRPPIKAGHRTVDKRAAKLRQAYTAHIGKGGGQ